MGGHNCACAEGETHLARSDWASAEQCCNNAVFNDVWMTVDTHVDEVGAKWACQTANYHDADFPYVGDDRSPTVNSYTKGVNKFSAVMTHDDTIFMMAGHKPNTTQGLNRVYATKPGKPRAAFDSTWLGANDGWFTS